MSARYELKDSKNDQYFWTLQGNNNETLLTSETYTTKPAAEKGIASAMANSPYDIRYQKGNTANGQHYFTLNAENHQKLGTSETYTSSWGRDNGIEACKKVGPSAPTVDLTKSKTGAYR
ncbi:MAG TPA: YegP family protein [Candidatus Polarisedimenticolaceae bacterium]|nr:YegP family protein [Candidatus Polarisedimenticolaceae bacterium]